MHEDVTERQKLRQRLEEQNLLLQRQGTELQTQNANLDMALANMSHGLAMFDAEERLVVANDRYAEVYGLEPQHLTPGTTLRALIEYRISKGLYDGVGSDEVLANMRERVARKRPSHFFARPGDGRVLSVSVQPREDGGWVVTLQDITERERLNARLEQQNMQLKAQEETLRNKNDQLDAALNNMLQGLSMYDSEQRLVMCNKRYVEIYGLSPEQVKPGTSLREIVERRMANGEYPGRNADELVTERIERIAGQRAAQYINQLSDGRYVAVSTQPMPDGGTVTTHHDITEQRQSEAKIAHMALHDTLTDLPNRALLNERLDGALLRVKRGEIVATLLLDLDNFKTVNDTLGHPAGDKLLVAVASRLRAVVRETDTIARMGGDEFAIVQTSIMQPADATALAHRLIETVSAPYSIDGHQMVIGTSIGIALGPSDGTSPDQLIRNADLALYRAKGDGRGTYSFFERDMDAQMQVRRALEYDLRSALSAGQFEMHYQAVLNLASDTVSGFEALIRWRHPMKGMVAPGAFIPLAEEMGLIVSLGEWALREACATAAKWPGELRIAVNLSPVQFRTPGLVQVIVGALASTGLAPERLELEITESTLLQDSEATLSTLYQLRALGVRIAMDDFGTGYSSLSYLQSFPFDKIKIDRSFIKDIADGVGSLNIVRAVAAMANGLGMTTTAEGVETQEQMDTVRAEGCTEMQGFLFCRPLPASDVEPFLRQCSGETGAEANQVASTVDAA
jgi:diguanylate cyclase (GGDEF)-like protein/PAS domain S-box-containing protein